MDKIKLPEGCEIKELPFKIAVKKIQKYWADNPSFLCYDFEETIGKDRIDDAIQKAYKLNLRNKNRRCANNNLRNWLRINTNGKTLFSKYCEDRKKQKYGRLKWVGKALFTKVVHKLHPDVIPIIDGKIYDCYRKKIGTNDLVKIAKIIVDDCKENKKCLQNICDTLGKIVAPQIKITPLRAWDILVWSYLTPKQT